MISTNNSAVNWMISKASNIEGSLNFRGSLNSRMANQVKAWFDQNQANYRSGSSQSCYSLIYGGFSFVLKCGAHKSTQNSVSLWIEKVEEDPDQAEFVNWWVI